MQKITPFLWFDNQAEEAVKFYTEIFKKSKILNETKYGKEGAAVSGQKEGSIMTISFELNGQKFTALNGGPLFKFSQAISFVINCDDQKEIDYYWDKLSSGGQIQQCGWLIDRYGITWQVIPAQLPELLTNKDPKKAQKAAQILFTMTKIEIAKLKQV